MLQREKALSMQDRKHGGDIYGSLPVKTDFSANLNPLGMPEQIRQALIASVDRVQPYPDPLCRSLASRASRALDIPGDNLVFGNGSCDLLYRLALCLRPRRVLIAGPAFSEYERACRLAGAEIFFAPASPEDSFCPNAEALAGTIREKGPDLVFIASPSNPAGTILADAELALLTETCRAQGSRLLLDLCFFSFTDRWHRFYQAGLLRDRPRLILLDSFTKIYAMAGVRFGYAATGDKVLAGRLRDILQPWPLSRPAVEAGQAGFSLMETGSFQKKTAVYVAGERERLASSLREQGFRVFPSRANYLLFRTEDRRLTEIIRQGGTDRVAGPGRTVMGEAMAQKGYPIRECGNYRGLDNSYFRLAVRTKEENAACMAALCEVMRRWANGGPPPGSGERKGEK